MQYLPRYAPVTGQYCTPIWGNRSPVIRPPGCQLMTALVDRSWFSYRQRHTKVGAADQRRLFRDWSQPDTARQALGFARSKNIPRKGPRNRRSLGYARDDKGEVTLPSRAVAGQKVFGLPRWAKAHGQRVGVLPL